MYKDLDPLLHQQLRLSVMSILIGVKDAEFNYIKEKTKSTAGNLSVQLNKLSEAGYITINKSFRDNYPLTTCAVTKQGVKAFDEYVKALKLYLNPSGDK
jgi:DNA-binding MarR family transcriptional regulator